MRMVATSIRGEVQLTSHRCRGERAERTDRDCDAEFDESFAAPAPTTKDDPEARLLSASLALRIGITLGPERANRAIAAVT
jgi:hypothetical protein